MVFLPAMALALTDFQLKTIMQAAAGIDPSRRDQFLQRVAAMLRLKGRFSNADVAAVAQLALAGLQHPIRESA
jgi:hypothetical protein